MGRATWHVGCRPHTFPASERTIRHGSAIANDLKTDQVTASLREHGFCQVTYEGRRIDVFVPMIEFYETARQRRKRVLLDERPIFIWDAESLCVFKLMFFRRKDLADLGQLLRIQGNQLDHSWVGRQIIQIYGERDPRVSQWRELVNELLPEAGAKVGMSIDDAELDVRKCLESPP